MCIHLGQQVVLEGLLSSSGENRGSQRDRLRTGLVMVSCIALVQAVAALGAQSGQQPTHQRSGPGGLQDSWMFRAVEEPHPDALAEY